jgi:hypothetical protein
MRKNCNDATHSALILTVFLLLQSTYEYGKQLCQVSLVLRRSLRMEVGPQLALSQRLETTWGRLCRSLTQYEAKTNITDAFHSTVKEVSVFRKSHKYTNKFFYFNKML